MATFIELFDDVWINLDQVVQVSQMADDSVRVDFTAPIYKPGYREKEEQVQSLHIDGVAAETFLRKFQRHTGHDA